MRLRRGLLAAGLGLVPALAAGASGAIPAIGPTQIVVLPPGTQGGDPDDLMSSGDYLYFTADDGIHGRELWKLDRHGKISMVLDLHSGSRSREIARLHDGNGILYFSAGGLYRSGGTPDTTFPLTDQLQEYHRGTSLGGLHYFFGPGPPGEHQLWATDGTAGGTRQYVSPGDPVSRFSGANTPPLVRFKDRIYMAAAKANAVGYGVYFVDEDSPEPTPLLDAAGEPVPCSATGTYFAAVGDLLFFTADDGAERHAIWVTDGSPELVRPAYVHPVAESFWVREIAAAGEIAIIQARTPSHGAELWRSDGTPEGSFLLKDIVPGPAGSSPYQFWPIGSESVFLADHPDYGNELWITDGSPAGTRLLKDLVPDPRSSDPYQLLDYGDWVLFVCENYTYGEELWRTDGTPEGTVMVKDIYPGPKDSTPYHLREFNGKVYFSAIHPAYGEELWETDGTEEGTRLTARIRPEVRAVGSSYPAHLTAYRDLLYFSADAGDGVRRLYRSGGTRESTESLLPRLNDGGHGVAALWAHGGSLHITTENPGGATLHWRTDGSPESLSRVEELPDYPDASPLRAILSPENYARLVRAPLPRDAWATLGNQTFFAAYTPETGSELWVADHDTGEAALFLDIMAGPASSSPDRLSAIGDAIYFLAEDSNKGKELWSSDGTRAGTRLLFDFNRLPLSGSPQFIVGDRGYIYTLSENPYTTPDLCILAPPDYGLSAVVLDLYDNGAFKDLDQLTSAGGEVYFTGSHVTYGNELWKIRQLPFDAPLSLRTQRYQLVRDIAPNKVYDALEGRWVDDYLAD